MADLTPQQLRWFKQQRGIDADTLARWGVHSEGEDKLIFPWPHNEKVRKGTFSGDLKRTWAKVAPGRALYGTNLAPETVRTAFLVEGETDTMRLDQALRRGGFDDAAVYGLSGNNWWLPEFAKDVSEPERVYVILDNDDPYSNPTAVANSQKTWLEIRQSVGPKARRVFLPQGVKDICEFFATYDIEGTDTGIEAIQTLCRSNAGGKLHFNYLDMTQPPPEYDFLVEDWFAMSDLVLAFGPPGAGKSWAMKALACAVCNGDQHWLGRAVNHQGPVVYVDQENPQDVFLNRFHQLGLTPEGLENLHPLWMQGIRLDVNGDQLMEDILTIQPKLIVFDSLSKIHNKKENDSGEMAGIFRDSLIPMARSGGAAVVVLHHVVKSTEGGSFERIRGSSSIPADIDFGMDFRMTGVRNEFKLVPYKPRRGQGARSITAQIEDVGHREDGSKITRVEPVLGPEHPM